MAGGVVHKIAAGVVHEEHLPQRNKKVIECKIQIIVHRIARGVVHDSTSHLRKFLHKGVVHYSTRKYINSYIYVFNDCKRSNGGKTIISVRVMYYFIKNMVIKKCNVFIQQTLLCISTYQILSTYQRGKNFEIFFNLLIRDQFLSTFSGLRI